MSFFVWLTFAPLPAQARWDAVPGSRYTSARAAAMGDSYMTLAADPASALFYQPAGLSAIPLPSFDLLNISAHANNDALSMLDRYSTDIFSLPTYAPRLQAREGKMPGVGGTFAPAISAYGFGVGVLISSDFSAQWRNSQIRHRSLYQLIPAVGGSIGLARGIVKVGYSLQWVNKAVGDVVQSSTDGNLAYNDSLKQGSGLSHNLGATLTFPIKMQPSFGIVARNIANVTYKSYTLYSFAKNTTGVPDTELMSVDASMSVSPKLAAKTDLHFSMSLLDIFNRSQSSILIRTVMGLEVGLKGIFFFRGGIGNFYPSLGFGIRQKFGEFSATWYSEEWGQTFWSSRNIKALVQYQLGF